MILKKMTKPSKMWKDEDFRWCVNNYKEMGVKDCAQAVNRTEGALRKRLQDFGYSLAN